jgi:hypothetical protein
MSAAHEFANVVDPFSLDTALLVCINDGQLPGAELALEDAFGSTGEHLEGNARSVELSGQCEYYVKVALTLTDDGLTANVGGSNAVAIGDTKNGYYIYGIKPMRGQKAHSKLQVSGRKHVNGDWSDECNN